MKAIFQRLLCLAACCASTVVFADPAPQADSAVTWQPARVELLKRELQESCKAWAAKEAQGKPGISTRDFTHYAHDLLALGGDVKEAQATALRGFAEQEMDPSSKTYGTVPWSRGKRAAHEDANAIEFTCLPLGAMLTRYHHQLSQKFLGKIQPHVQAALAAIRRHEVHVSYTNIFLMKTTNLLLLGEASGDAGAMDEALANLDAWLDYTRHNGIGEFNSPTYGETQINSAATAYNNTANPKARAKLHKVLDYLWADVCANFVPGIGQVGGALSRNYDFVYATGPLDRYLFLTGLRDIQPTPTLFNDESGPVCDAIETSPVAGAMPMGYSPSRETLALAAMPRKEFTSRFGPESGMDRTFYSTPEFSIGSAGHAYGPQDRTIGLNFGVTKKLPAVAVFLDPMDMPDGSERIEGEDGHAKPKHLQPRQVVVQEQGTVLALFNLASAVHGAEYQSIGLNVLLPAKADGIWLDGQKLNATAPLNKPCNCDSVVVVREGSAVLMVHLFALDGLAGFTPTFALKNDAAKGEVVRLVGYAFQGPPREFKDKTAHAGLLMMAEPCPDDAAFSEFMKRVGKEHIKSTRKEGAWTVSCLGLEAGLDESGKTIARKIHGSDAAIPGAGRLNGKDLGELLRD